MGFVFFFKFNKYIQKSTILEIISTAFYFLQLLMNETASCGAPQTYKSLLQSIVSLGVE